MSNKRRGPTPAHPYRGLRQPRPRKARTSTMEYYTNRPVNYVGGYVRTNRSVPDFPPGGGTTTNKFRLGLNTVYASRSGSKVPGYRSLINTQQDASSGYSRTDYYFEDFSEGFAKDTYYDKSARTTNSEEIRGWLLYPNNGAWPNPLNVMSTALDNQAQTQFLAKLYQKRTTFQGGVFLGELHKTIRDLRRPLHALHGNFFKFVQAAKTKASSRRIRRTPTSNGRRLKAVSDAISGTWLEFVFGWKPLVNDIDDAVHALSYMTQRSPVEHVVGSATAKAVYDFPGSILSCGYYIFTLQERASVETKVKYTGGLHVLLDDVTAGMRRSDIGLTLSNFVPSVWELLPYSFLVDYFVNVGQVLEASMASTQGLIYLTRSVHTKNTYEILQKSKADNLDPNSLTLKRLDSNSQLGSCRMVYSSYSRNVVQPGSLAPSLRVTLPLDKPLRLANMAALVAQGKSVSNFLLHLGRSS